MANPVTAEDLLAEARSGLMRLDPPAAAAAVGAGAVLVDIRSELQRERDGVVPGDEGHQSSLAAANLKRLGFERATDLAGGFRAWRAAGLPVDVEG